ncbi:MULTISPECIES: PqiB family protein [Ralstonia]|jgi:paraquat-inducible protein B|nr:MULTISPECIES: MlaD family protein [Ralstonia]MBA4203246.1 mammalian cell entry protein [Ralstonia sp.]MBA4233639.1 mammalian cell entry protein [Ralstonia sp.]MBA4238630.1 mammalian cell entry protein [Ralstonia sp.]POH85953.1 mammalian cell entry protein [Ralstonia pickettii]
MRPIDLPLPEIMPPRRWLPSIVWLVPLIAALIGLALVAKTIAEKGPVVTVTFSNAEGLEAGKTKVKYKDVEIGTIQAISLTPDLKRVTVKIQLAREAERFAARDTRFWVVRPRVGASGISGLGTLLSGAYIGVDIGHSKDSQTQFVGLESPPSVTTDQQGRQFSLHGDSLGSVDIGAPVFYRHLQVGQVVGFALDKQGGGVQVKVFVNAPYDKYVGTNTRWWHASGVDLRLDSSGLKLNTQSLATVIVGGLAFQSPQGQADGPPPPDSTVFQLASDEADAMREPDGAPLTVVMRFNQSLRGLSVGAPVDLRGIALGNVTDIGIEYDEAAKTFSMRVVMALYPSRLSRRSNTSLPAPDTPGGHEMLQHLVMQGLRGQLRMGNLLTGQLYVALDMFPKAPRATVDVHRSPVELPTVPNSLDELQVQLADIAKKLNQVPFDKIGSNLNGALENANRLFGHLDTEVVPQARDTLASAQQTFNAAQATLRQDSPLQSDVHEAMQELTRTLQSLNALTDYLERHPESLLFGKKGDAR